MNILLIIHETLDPNSGAAGSTFKLMQNYRDLGHEVSCYSLDDLPPNLPPLVKRILFPEFVAMQIVKSNSKFDVVDASTGDAWLWAKIFHQIRNTTGQKKSPNTPLLVTRSHGLEHLKHLTDLEDAKRGDLSLSWKYFLYRGSIQLWEVAQALRSSDLVFLLNQEERHYVIEKLGVQADRALVFANGIPEKFLNLPWQPLPADGSLRIAQVGTYIPRKGIQYSAPVLNRILQRYPQVQVTFLGTQCHECQDVAQVYADYDPKLHDRIQVIPRYRHDLLPSLLEGHHIKLFTPLSEGFGKALVEAMACGLAPITTSAPGPMEVVRDGHDAIVIPPRDSEAIEQALERLIGDRPYLEQLRRQAYATAQKYSWKRIAQDRLAAYQKALQSKNKTPLKSTLNPTVYS